MPKGTSKSKTKRPSAKQKLAKRVKGAKAPLLSKAEAIEALRKLTKRHEGLKIKHRDLKGVIKEQADEIAERGASNAEWDAAVEALENEVDRLKKKNKPLEERVIALRAKVSDLERGVRAHAPARSGDEENDEVNKTVQVLRNLLAQKDAEIATLRIGGREFRAEK